MDIALLLMVAVVVPYLPSVLVSLSRLDQPLEQLGWVAVVGKWIEFALTAALAAYLLLRHGLPATGFGIHRRRIVQQIAWAPAILVVVYGVMLATAIVISMFWLAGGQAEQEIDQRFEFVEAMPVGRFDIAVPLMIAVALHEELLFRGMLMPYLRRLTGSWTWAVLGSSAIFASLHFHQGLTAVVQIGFVSIVLSLGFLLSRSLLAVVLAHCAFNLLQLQLMRILQELLNNGDALT